MGPTPCSCGRDRGLPARRDHRDDERRLALVGRATAAARRRRAIVGEVLAVALAAGLCILLALIWIHTPRRSKARKKPGGPRSPPTRSGSSLRAGSLVLIGGILVVVALLLAFWFLLEQADQAQPPPPSATTIGDAAALPPAGAARRPHHRSSTGSSSGWSPRSRSSCPSRSLPAAGFGRPTSRAGGRRGARIGRSGGRRVDRPDRARPGRPSRDHPCLRADGARIRRRGRFPGDPHEAPFEYLGRALRGVRVSPPAAGRLAALFERARFSQHVVDAETKDDAIGALREIERQLQAPSS